MEFLRIGVREYARRPVPAFAAGVKDVRSALCERYAHFIGSGPDLRNVDYGDSLRRIDDTDFSPNIIEKTSVLLDGVDRQKREFAFAPDTEVKSIVIAPAHCFT